MSDSNVKTKETINLKSELDLCERLRREFTILLASLSGLGVHATTKEDLDALSHLLFETTEARKILEKQEKELKAELKRHFAQGEAVLDCGPLIALLDLRIRTDLDREVLLKDFGPEFIERYSKKTAYETLTLKKKTVLS